MFISLPLYWAVVLISGCVFWFLNSIITFSCFFFFCFFFFYHKNILIKFHLNFIIFRGEECPSNLLVIFCVCVCVFVYLFIFRTFHLINIGTFIFESYRILHQFKLYLGDLRLHILHLCYWLLFLSVCLCCFSFERITYIYIARHIDRTLLMILK